MTRRKPNLAQLQMMDGISKITYGLEPGASIVVLMNGPMYHSATYAYAMLAFRHRCRIVLQPRFDPEGLLALIEQHRVTDTPTWCPPCSCAFCAARETAPLRPVLAAAVAARRPRHARREVKQRHDRVVGSVVHEY